MNARALIASAVAALAATAPAANCTEPNCDVTYHGGLVIRSPRVYLYFWGPKWKSTAAETSAKNYLIAFYKGLGAGPDSWSLTAAQYFAGSATTTFT